MKKTSHRCDWRRLRAREPVTPRQVELLEEFIEREMGQPFTPIFFEVGQVEEIRHSEPRR